jgi:hypothetical protein
MELNAELKDYIDKAVDVVDISKDPTDWKVAKNIIQGFLDRRGKKYTTHATIQRKLKQL